MECISNEKKKSKLVHPATVLSSSIQVGRSSGKIDRSGEPNCLSFRGVLDALFALTSSVSKNAFSSADRHMGLLLRIIPLSVSSSSDMCVGLSTSHLPSS